MNVALTHAVRALAEGLGFEAWGIAAVPPLAEPLPPLIQSAYERYLHWITQGNQAGMRYLADNPELRRHPAYVLPGTRSILLVLQSYFHTRAAVSPIAQYAWGKDYHTNLYRRLDIIADYLRRQGEEARPFVDTAPILEKAWAVQAGLGWIGKNTLLISRKAGSYTFIGGVLTTASLVPDSPFTEDLCGRCNRCIEACPTGALEPYVLDARRCIAYWTIEATPLEEGCPYTHGWLFGCDICQQVCPWNRFAKPQGELAFRPQAYAFWPREKWTTLSRSQVKKLQQGTALRRTRPEKLLQVAAQQTTAAPSFEGFPAKAARATCLSVEAQDGLPGPVHGPGSTAERLRSAPGP